MPDALVLAVLLAQVATTWYMTGLIWFVQVVHYPLYGCVGKLEFTAFEQRHTALTTWVVGPPMLVEALTAVLLFWHRPLGIADWQIWLGAALLALVWLSTALLQVPCHNHLSRQFDAAVQQRLVAGNWIRTAAWSARGALVLSMLGSICHV